MCDPTPISTVYSLSTSTEWSTSTSSWAVLSTPDVQIQTITETACATTAPTSSPSPESTTWTTDQPSTSTEWGSQSSANFSDTDGDESDGGWVWTKRQSKEHVNALALPPTSTTTPSSTAPMSDEQPSQTTSKRGEVTPSPSIFTSTEGAKTTSAVSSDRKVLTERSDDEGCLSWSMTTRYSTYTPPVATIWSTTVIDTSSESVVNVPISTVYAQCTSSTVSSTSTRISSATSSTSASATSSRVTSSYVRIQGAQTASTVPSSTNQAQTFADTTETSPSPTSSTVSSPTTTSTTTHTQTDNPLIQANQQTSGSSSTPTSKNQSTTKTVSGDLATATSTSKTSKGVAAGAVIGSLAALVFLIAASLVLLRWWRRRKRVERTRQLRSSWFYGGDVAEPEVIDHDEIVPRSKVSSEKRASSPPIQSRFSAPSLISRSSYRHSQTINPAPALALPSFLSHPISHLRNTSGRFPNVLADIRKSVIPDRKAPAWAEKYSYPSPGPSGAARDVMGDMEVLPPLPPTYNSAREALKNDRISAPLRVCNQAPQLDLPETNPNLNLDWQTDVHTSPQVLARYLTGISDSSSHTRQSQSKEAPPQGHFTLPPPFRGQEGVASYHSVYSSPDSLNSDPRRSTIGQALSPPGEDTIEISQFPIPPGMTLTFPKPLLQHPSPPSNSSVPLPESTHAPQGYSPNVGLKPLAPAEDCGMAASSLFEFASYAGTRDSNMTTRTGGSRITKNWYDKPLWDAQEVRPQHPLSRESGVSQESGVWAYGKEDTDQARKSRGKSVRWDDEPIPKVFELARAL